MWIFHLIFNAPIHISSVKIIIWDDDERLRKTNHVSSLAKKQRKKNNLFLGLYEDLVDRLTVLGDGTKAHTILDTFFQKLSILK